MQTATRVSITVTHFKLLGTSDDDGITGRVELAYENGNNILFIQYLLCCWDFQQEIHSSIHIQNTNNHEEVLSLLLHLECVMPNDK